jgi:hypothetical protein
VLAQVAWLHAVKAQVIHVFAWLFVKTQGFCRSFGPATHWVAMQVPWPAQVAAAWQVAPWHVLGQVFAHVPHCVWQVPH